MKCPQSIGFVTLGLWLSLESLVGRVEAGPYVTHRTDETSREVDPRFQPLWSPFLQPPFSSQCRQVSTLSISLDSGRRDAITAALARTLALPSIAPPQPIGRSPEGEPGIAPVITPAPTNRAVPEPAPIVLVVTALIGLAARRHLLRNRPWS